MKKTCEAGHTYLIPEACGHCSGLVVVVWQEALDDLFLGEGSGLKDNK